MVEDQLEKMNEKETAILERDEALQGQMELIDVNNNGQEADRSDGMYT
jgi:hypothetical protein